MKNITLLIALSCFTPQITLATITPLFSPKDDVKKEIINQIDIENEFIDLAMYSFSDKSIQKKLITAAMRGVIVRVILNKANSQKKLADHLEKNNIDVKYVTPVMHHKFAVFSNKTILSGSGNWSKSSSSKYDEDLLKIENENKIYNSYQSEFNYLWKYSKEYGLSYEYNRDTNDSDELSTSVVFTSSNMTPYYRGSNPSFKTKTNNQSGVAGSRIINEIDQAKEIIKIATAHFRRDDIFESLKNALKRGIIVQIVLDAQEFNSYPSGDSVYYDEKLSELGADVRYKTYSRYWDYKTALQMHSKYMIVDNESVLTGSLNWSYNSELKSMENLINLKNETLAQSYNNNFEKIFNYSQTDLGDLKQEIFENNGDGPCSWSPLTLSGQEIKELRKEFRSSSCRTNN